MNDVSLSTTSHALSSHWLCSLLNFYEDEKGECCFTKTCFIVHLLWMHDYNFHVRLLYVSCKHNVRLHVALWKRMIVG